MAWNYQISKNFLRLEYNALDSYSESKLIGKIKNFNTLDAFKVRAGTNFDILVIFKLKKSPKITVISHFMLYQLSLKVFNKKGALKDQLQLVRGKIDANSWCLNDLLSPLIISFADLKKYHYYYWMCFPTFKLQGTEFELKSGHFEIENFS